MMMRRSFVNLLRLEKTKMTRMNCVLWMSTARMDQYRTNHCILIWMHLKVSSGLPLVTKMSAGWR